MQAMTSATPEDVHAYYLTTLDFHTGAVRSRLFVGSGEAIDSPMLSVGFWPDRIYVGGVRNGIVTLRDTHQ